MNTVSPAIAPGPDAGSRRAVRSTVKRGVLLVGVLVVGFAGSATASVLVTGKQIAADTIEGRDLRNGTVRGLDVQNGWLTRRDFKLSSIRGFVGDPGATGPEGPPGPTTNGIGLVATRTASAVGTGFVSVVTRCLPGERVLGGSVAALVDPNLIRTRIVFSAPFRDPNGLEGWTAGVRNITPIAQYTASATARCAPVPPTSIKRELTRE
jgi:hypothetical protein